MKQKVGSAQCPEESKGCGVENCLPDVSGSQAVWNVHTNALVGYKQGEKLGTHSSQTRSGLGV